MNSNKRSTKAAAPKKTRSSGRQKTVKTLTLIRHAKSSQKFSGLDDLDRPLTTRGRNEAALMGRLLASRVFVPDRWISSNALRAIRTAEVIAEAAGYPTSGIEMENRLYHNSIDDMLALLRETDVNITWVACVAHDPELTNLVNLLTSKDIDNLPTCGVVELRFAVKQWKDLGKSKPLSISLDFPKNHK